MDTLMLIWLFKLLIMLSSILACRLQRTGCNRVDHPRMYQRRCAAANMVCVIDNCLVETARHFMQHKLYTHINIAGLPACTILTAHTCAAQ